MQTALDALISVGPFTLAVALLLGSMGIPVPASLMMLAAGALVRQGRFSGVLVFICAVAGATLGNIASYQMGKYGLKGLVKRLEKGKSWRKAENTFREKGVIGVFLTRWLLTPLALPTNLIAGGERFPLPKFIAACFSGAMVWVGVYGGLGYAFGAAWRTVAEQASRFSGWLIGGIALFALVELFLHWRGHLTHHKELMATDEA